MNRREREYIEKRRSLRFTIDEFSIVAYRVGFLHRVLWRKKNIAQTVVNLSYGGVCLILDQRVPDICKMRMLLILNKFNDVFEADGEVRWLSLSKRRSGYYETGIKFKRLDPVHSMKLEHIKKWFTSEAYRVQRQTTKRRKEREGLTFKRP